MLKPSSLQGGPSFNLQNLLGEIERIMAHAYFPYFSSLFLVFVSCISFPPWLIPCTKVEEINQHSCASDTQSFTTSVAIFLDISLKHLFYLKPGSTAAWGKDQKNSLWKAHSLEKIYTSWCMLKFCTDSPACPSSKGNPWLRAERQDCEESSPSLAMEEPFPSWLGPSKETDPGQSTLLLPPTYSYFVVEHEGL